MPKYPHVSIIILNYNGLKDTIKCLKSVLKTDYPNFQIILVDNGSKINEAEILTSRFHSRKIRFVRFEKNYGFSGGNNKVIQDLKDKYVVLLNNDTETPHQWLTPLVALMEKNTNIAVVQPKILWMKKKSYFDYAGACGGFIDIFGYPFTRGRVFHYLERDNGQYDTLSDIFWASGAAMMIRTSIFKKIGLFDERFFNYMEEIDLCYRIHQKGYRIMSEPKSYIYHKGAATASRNNLKKRFWEHRNSLMLLIKYCKMPKLLLIFPMRIVQEYFSLLYYVYIRRADFVAAIILSQLSLIILAPSLIVDRLKNQQLETAQMKKLTFSGSVVFVHFILRQKTFSQIFHKNVKIYKILT